MAFVRSPSVAHGLALFCLALRAHFEGRVSELVVFGSHARGDATDASDVDVLVVINGLTDAEKRHIVDMAYDANAAAEDWLGLSPLPCSTDDARELRRSGRRLWRDIATEGIPL